MRKAILLMFCAAGLFAGGYFLGKMQDNGEDGMDVTYRVVTDTVRHTMPASKRDTTIRYDIVRLARADDGSWADIDKPNKPDRSDGIKGYGNGTDIDKPDEPNNIKSDDDEDNGADERDEADKYRSTEDSVRVRVPITQRVYGDSSYTAWVSGYRARLDSIEIYPRTEIMTVNAKEKKREQRWGIGIQAGYGVTVGKSPQFTPYIGVGVSYNLIKF